MANVYDITDFQKNMDKMEKQINNNVESLLLSPIKNTNAIVENLAKPIKPIVNQAQSAMNVVQSFNDKVTRDISRILFSTYQRNLFEAMLADIVDIIPGLGDITEAERLADARRHGDKEAVVAHGIDTAFGELADAIPIAGEIVDSILDALLPSNTLLYLKRKGIIEWHPPLPPLPNLNFKR